MIGYCILNELLHPSHPTLPSQKIELFMHMRKHLPPKGKKAVDLSLLKHAVQKVCKLISCENSKDYFLGHLFVLGAFWPTFSWDIRESPGYRLKSPSLLSGSPKLVDVWETA